MRAHAIAQKQDRFRFPEINLLPTQRALEHRDAGDIAGLERPSAFLRRSPGCWHRRTAGAQAEELSGGAQRVALARALINRPRSCSRRAHRQPGFEKLEHRSRMLRQSNQNLGQTVLILRTIPKPPRMATASCTCAMPNRDARGRPAVVSPSTSGSHTVLNDLNDTSWFVHRLCRARFANGRTR